MHPNLLYPDEVQPDALWVGSRRGPAMRVGYLLIPSFALLPYASAIEPLRAANTITRQQLFSWVHLTPDGAPIRASNGVTIVPEFGAGETCDVDVVMVCAGSGVENFDHSATFSWLRTLARQGVVLGGISGGAYVLARAGLLNGYRCTIHWDHIAGIVEEFPDLEITGKLFEVDRDRFTCSGGISPLDLLHHLMKTWHDPHLAAAMSDWFLHTSVRPGDAPQRMDIVQRTGINHGKLLKVISTMEQRLEEPASRSELARMAGLSLRQLERLFQSHAGSTLASYYLRLRLERSRNLLRQTTMSVLEVALSCGFISASHFSRAYRSHFGHPPRQERAHDRSSAAMTL